MSNDSGNSGGSDAAPLTQRLKRSAKRVLAASPAVLSAATKAYRTIFHDKEMERIRRDTACLRRISELAAQPGVVRVSFEAGAAKIWMRDGTAFNLSGNPNTISILTLLKGGYEDKETDFLVKLIRPGWTVVDAGANFGWYSVHFSKAVGADGKVFAFEPIPRTFAELAGNLQLNACGNVEPVNYALGSESGPRVFRVPNDALGCGAASAHLEMGTDVPVTMSRLDEFVESRKIEKLDFIKADIEGGELGLLKGAEKTIDRFKPDLLIEIFGPHCERFGYKPKDIVSFLIGKGYRAQYFDRNGTLVETREPHEQATNYYFTVRGEGAAAGISRS